MRRVVSLFVCLILIVLALAACAPEHEHTFDTKWQYDGEYHWKQATCEHTEEVSEKAAHMDDDENDLCDECGCAMEHTHTYESTWTQSEKTHYYKPTCGCADEAKYRKDEADHADKDNDGLCDVCKYDYGHKHTYADKWTATEGGHWHAPTCGHDVDGKDKADHKDTDNDGVCDDCQDDGGHSHTYADEWSSDENEHWHAPTCGHDVDGSEKGAHADADKDGKCDVCAYVPEHFHSFEEAWTADQTGHWHKATCEHADQKDGFAAHTGFEKDGVCEVCAYTVMFTVRFELPDYVKVVDKDNKALTGPFLVKEGEELVVYLAVPDFAKLVLVEGADYESEGTKVGDVYLYKVIVTPKANTTVSAAANKLKACEIIVNGQKLTLNVTKFQYLYQPIKFNAPEAGRYVIYCLGDSDIRFADSNATEDSNELMESSPYLREYVFQVDKAGEVALKAQYFAWDSKTVEVKYYIVKLEDEMVLPYLQGSGYTMPTNAEMKISFTLPEVGLYHITSSWDVEWNGSLEDCVINCTKAGQKVELKVRLVSNKQPTFDFDWNIIKLDPVKDLVLGNTQITATPGYFVPVRYTASQSGTYLIKAEHQELLIHFWGTYGSDEYRMLSAGQSYRVRLDSGKSVVVYVKINEYSQNEITKDITSKVNVEYLGYVPEGNGTYSVIPNTPALWINDGYAGEYEFTVATGSQISFDGGKTWLTGTILKELTAGQRVTYMVRNSNGSTGNVTVNIGEKIYSFTLEVGTNTVTMIPGKQYSVYLSGGTESADMTLDYILSWTESKLSATMGRLTLTSPATLDAYFPRNVIYMTYSGDAEAKVTFTLEDKNGGGSTVPEDPDVELKLGNNDIQVTDAWKGTDAVFTAPESNTYVFYYADNENNGSLMLVAGNGTESFDLPKEVTLTKGQTIKLNVSTANRNADTVSIMIVRKGEEPKDYSAMLPLLNGRYEVNLTATLYQVMFVPNSTGSTVGKLVLTDSDGDNEDMGGTYTYSFSKSTGLTITKADGSAAAFQIGLSDSGKLTFLGGKHMSSPVVMDVHTHAYSANGSDADNHWKECACGEKKDVVAHSFAPKTDAVNHWNECSCGHKKDVAPHSFQNKTDAASHWKECACGYKTGEAAHSYTDKKDATHHWSECSCGLTKDKAAHSFALKEDASGHWNECTACGHKKDEKHTVATEWTTDENNHWHICSCGAVVDKKPHEDKDNNAVCDGCGKAVSHIHTWSDQWSADESGHWHTANCACGNTTARTDEAAHTYDASYKCTVCGYQHNHTWSTEYTSDGAGKHYQVATCHTGVKSEPVACQDGDDANNNCDTCGYDLHTTCTWAKTWSTDKTYHWHACTNSYCSKVKDKAVHDGYESDGKCDTCGLVVFTSHTVTVKLPAGMELLDMNGHALSTPITGVREGAYRFQVAFANTYEVKVTGAELKTYTQKDGKVYYTVEIPNVTADTTVTFELKELSAVGTSVSTSVHVGPHGYDGSKTGNLTFNITEPGTYIIWLTGADCVTTTGQSNNPPADIRVGTGDSDFSYTYEIEVKEAKTVTLKYYVGASFYLEYTDLTLHFTAVKKQDKVSIKLPCLIGSCYELPSDSVCDYKEVKVTLPVAGTYQFATSIRNLYWYMSPNGNGSKQFITYTTTKANQEVTLYVKYDNGKASFDFDWDISLLEEAEDWEASSGNHTITSPAANKLYGITFQADKGAGAYSISPSLTWNSSAGDYSDSDYKIWLYRMNSDGSLTCLGNSATVQLKANEKITLYFAFVPESNREPVDPQIVLKNSYQGSGSSFTVRAYLKTPCAFVNLAAGTYTIKVPSGFSVSIEGNLQYENMEKDFTFTHSGGDIVLILYPPQNGTTDLFKDIVITMAA